MKKSAQVHKQSLRPSGLKGFTLVELLVVIAIIAILAAVVVLIINPLELTRRSRDAARLTDLANLQQAINVSLQEATGNSAAILCAGNAGTAPCRAHSVADGRETNGSGWVLANLGAQTSVSVPILPIDPVNPNDATNHYTYCSDGNNWKIVTDLESTQMTVTSNKEAQDGGTGTTETAGTRTSAELYEVGSSMSLACDFAP